MFHGSTRLFEAMLRVLFPATGRHRTPDVPRSRRVRRQRRRWTFWLAAVGVDAGPRRIHGGRAVAAR